MTTALKTYRRCPADAADVLYAHTGRFCRRKYPRWGQILEGKVRQRNPWPTPALILTARATLARQSNGTYTPDAARQAGDQAYVTGCLTGLTIGDVTYTGTLTGEIEKGERHPDHQEPARFGADRQRCE